jgi:hypothetical protein
MLGIVSGVGVVWGELESPDWLTGFSHFLSYLHLLVPNALVVFFLSFSSAR